MVLDVGWQIGRDEVNADIPAVDLTNGQQHIVEVRRWNKGRGITVAVRTSRKSCQQCVVYSMKLYSG